MSNLEITEEWIKVKVKITNEKLDDIKSLALPGTYDEKIFKVGNSLNHFNRLKELDLSRNCLETVYGLDHLVCLESLNLYYNNIGALKELYKLRHNEKLSQLDLRLNPVARNEADYRLCLIHMLPLLIRLDDRCVKDQERKAGLMYFGSDQSLELSSARRRGSELSPSGVTCSSSQPRVDMVSRWTRGIIQDNEMERQLLQHNQQARSCIAATSGSPSRRAVQHYSPRERLDVERECSYLRQLDASLLNTNTSTVPVLATSDEKNINNGRSQRNLKDRNKVEQDNKPNIRQVSVPHDFESLAFGDKTLIDMQHQICTLVDRYWTDRRGLQHNTNFLTSLNHVLTNWGQIQYKELSKRVDGLEKENSVLNEQLKKANRSQSGKCNGHSNSDIQRVNDALKVEIKELEHRLDASERMSAVTELLKQSHESLIVTNEQLRHQLRRHNKNDPDFLLNTGCY